MTRATFQGDPYATLGVAYAASPPTIKARWRRLARRHHPDLAGSDPEAAREATRRMASINGAYDLLADPERRAAWDRRHGIARAPGGSDRPFVPGTRVERPAGPPRPRPTRPVTGRVDASALFRPRNATLTPPDLRTTSPGLPPRPRGAFAPPHEPLRASVPCGPVRRRRSGRPAPRPALDEALEVLLEFGRFRGHTLGEVAAFEPTYIDWIARTISRDRDLVVAARVVQEELDRLGVPRGRRATTPGFGVRREGLESA